MQKNFTLYELKVLHYGLLNAEQTHFIFKSLYQFFYKNVLNLNFAHLFKSLTSIMHKLHGKQLLIMDKYHLAIIVCQHCAHYKSCKMNFGPSFFLSDLVHPTMPRPLCLKALGSI